MELISWTVYGLFLIGPYILAVVIISATIFFFVKLTFHINKWLGHAMLIMVTCGLGFLCFKYLWSIPASFRLACASGSGIKVIKKVKASSYTLMYPLHPGGLAKMSDATFEQAIFNVATKKVAYVELQDSFASSFRYGLVSKSLEKYRKSTDRAGYYKVFISSRGSAQCRWLMPIDLNLPENLGGYSHSKYRDYLSKTPSFKVNESLQVPASGKECVAVEYVSTPISTYSVEILLNQKVDKYFYKHEIRVVDSKTKDIIGENVAYEYDTDSVYASVAFWVGNNKGHPRCPLNMLAGNPLQKILNI